LASFLFYSKRIKIQLQFKITVMKKFLLSIAIIATVSIVMVSCKNGTTATAIATEDTAGLAQYQQWKYQNEIAAQVKLATANQAASSIKRSSSTSGKMTSSSTSNAKVAEKKGWSKAAKGAAIGGASGAILGAVINKKNRVAGGVIGGVIGGGVGYGIGRSQDKKDGRY